jgi:hypothetical protein
MNFETSFEVEVAIARHFGITTHVIVPNVSWGMFRYELDLVVLNSKSFYADEVEIKISRSDLKRDSKKHHNHDWNGNMIRRLYFAMPEKLSNCLDLVPERAGILLVESDGRVKVWRNAKIDSSAHKWTFEQAFKLGRLGTMRVWDLKSSTRTLKQQLKTLWEGKHPICEWRPGYGENYFFTGCHQHIHVERTEINNIVYRFCPGCGGEVRKILKGNTGEAPSSGRT